MSSGIRGAAGGRPAVSPVSVLAWVLIAFCAVLLVKWLALAAVVALVLYGLVRWVLRARRGAVVELDVPPSGRAWDADAPGDGPPEYAGTVGGWFGGGSPDGADCTWCGLAGGHHDTLGRPVRPRYAHVLR